MTGVCTGGRPTWPGHKAFVGGTLDVATGLTHLGAREYDPTLGRFISVDPIMDLADPQQLHGYTYANYDPTTHSDPTGLIPDYCGTDVDCYGYSPHTGCPHGCGTEKNVKWGESKGWNKGKKPKPKLRPPMKRVGTHLVGADSWDTWATGWLAAMKLYKDAGNPDLELDCLDYERGDCWSPALLMNVAEFRAEYFCVQPGIICPGDAGDTNLLAVLAATADAAVLGGGTGQRIGGVKPVNFPSWKKIDINMNKIVDYHSAAGTTYQRSGVKTKFPDSMSPGEIESTVRQAYRYSSQAGPSQGERHLMRGNANGLTVEMWVNVRTRTIETAYPVWK